MHTTCLRFSQCTTSFIGTRRQGILRAPLVPAPHHSRRRILVRRYFSRVVGAALPLLSRADTPPGLRAARLALSCSIWIVNLPPASRQRPKGFAAPPATHRNFRCATWHDDLLLPPCETAPTDKTARVFHPGRRQSIATRRVYNPETPVCSLNSATISFKRLPVLHFRTNACY